MESSLTHDGLKKQGVGGKQQVLPPKTAPHNAKIDLTLQWVSQEYTEGNFSGFIRFIISLQKEVGRRRLILFQLDKIGENMFWSSE